MNSSDKSITIVACALFITIGVIIIVAVAMYYTQSYLAIQRGYQQTPKGYWVKVDKDGQ